MFRRVWAAATAAAAAATTTASCSCHGMRLAELVHAVPPVTCNSHAMMTDITVPHACRILAHVHTQQYALHLSKSSEYSVLSVPALSLLASRGSAATAGVCFHGWIRRAVAKTRACACTVRRALHCRVDARRLGANSGDHTSGCGSDRDKGDPRPEGDLKKIPLIPALSSLASRGSAAIASVCKSWLETGDYG